MWSWSWTRLGTDGPRWLLALVPVAAIAGIVFTFWLYSQLS